MKNMRIYVTALVVILATYFITKSCEPSAPTKQEVKSDTIYVPKIIKIPAISEVFENKSPKPKDGTVVYDQKLILEYKKLKTENERLKKFEELAQKREYDSTYSDSKGLVTVKVKSNTTGFLDYQRVEFNIREQEVEYLDREITNTITQKIKPKFIVSGGVSTQFGLEPNRPTPSIGATIGFKNSSGYSLDANYNTNKEVMLTLKKDIFTFWETK